MTDSFQERDSIVALVAQGTLSFAGAGAFALHGLPGARWSRKRDPVTLR